MGTMMKSYQKINKENTEKLNESFKYVYNCSKCPLKYGSDDKEKKPYLCPKCEEK